MAPTLRVIGILGLLLSLASLASSCAEALDFGEACTLPNRTISAVVSAPDPTAGMDCAQRDGFAAQVTASLELADREAIELSMNGDTLLAKTAIANLTTDESYPLVLVYALPDSGGGEVHLAYRWGTIDLTGIACTEPTTLDGETQLLLSPTDIDNLLAGSHGGDTDRVVNGAALLFAQELLVGPGYDLDQDGDDVTNLDEACAGTL